MYVCVCSCTCVPVKSDKKEIEVVAGGNLQDLSVSYRELLMVLDQEWHNWSGWVIVTKRPGRKERLPARRSVLEGGE